jgi:hypothetical protein
MEDRALLQPYRKGMPLYQGKTKTCCKGRVIIGSKPHMAVITFFLVNIPTVLNMARIIPNFKDEKAELGLYIGLGLLAILVNILGAETAGTNPGILPRMNQIIRARSLS